MDKVDTLKLSQTEQDELRAKAVAGWQSQNLGQACAGINRLGGVAERAVR